MPSSFNMYDLTQHVAVATHISGHTLDLSITRCNHELVLSDPGADYMVSDHTFVCSQIKLPKPLLAMRTISYHKLKNIDKSAFSAELKDLSAELLFINDPNKLVDGYSEGLQKLLDKHAPTKTKTIVRPCVPGLMTSHRRYTDKILRKKQKNTTSSIPHQKCICSIFEQQTYISSG